MIGGKPRPIAPGGDNAETFGFYRMRDIRRKFRSDSGSRRIVQQAAYFKMMRALRLADLFFKTDDLHPVFAQRAIHCSAAFYGFLRARQQDIGNVRMYAQITGFEDFQTRLPFL